jgi:nucleoside-triphosphatase
MEAFERLVLPLLKPSKAIKLHVIDEVGRMELQSEHFKDALMALLASPNVAVFGSLPACRYGHDLPFVEAIKQRSDTGAKFSSSLSCKYHTKLNLIQTCGLLCQQ